MADEKTVPKTFAGFGFKSLKLESIEELSPDVKRLRFALPTEDALSGLSLTSSLLSITWPKGRFLPVPRPYTPVNDLNEPGHLTFIIKRYPKGKASTHLHSLQPGDSVPFMPLKGPAWKPSMYPAITLIAGGAGITPMAQLIRGILANPDDTTRITLIWGVNTDADLFLRKEFEALKERCPGRLETHYTVSKPVAGSTFDKGHVDQAMLETKGVVSMDGVPTRVFVCGPPAMEASLTGKGGALAQLGFKKGEVIKF